MRSISEIIDSGSASPSEMEWHCISERSVLVVRFLDDRSDLCWWKREHEELGRVFAYFLDGKWPVNKAEMHSFVRANFGDEAHLIY